MKHDRLDQILLRLGYVTDRDVARAYARKKAHHSRIGSQLLELRSVTEDQLAQALSLQHNVPGFRLEEHEIDTMAVRKLPYEIAFRHGALPVRWDRRNRTLALAVVDPGDREMKQRVTTVFGALNLEMFVAAESVVMRLISQYYLGRRGPDHDKHFELPYYFSRRGRTVHRTPRLDHKPRHVLMVATSRSTRELLGPVFESEGIQLHVAGDVETVARLLDSQTFDHILVSGESVDTFSGWWREGRIPPITTDVSAFSSVIDTLLEHPVSYRRMHHSLRRALQITAELRCSNASWMPPYAVICNDLQRLSRAAGLRRVATDGLQVAACLLVPGELGDPLIDANDGIEDHLRFVDFEKSLDDARWLQFPWNIYGMLQIFRGLAGGKQPVADTKKRHPELVLAARILLVVWYHLVGLRQAREDCEDPMSLHGRLRAMGTRMAGREVVDAYIHMLERDHRAHRTTRHETILILSRNDEIASQFSGRLNDTGFDALVMNDLDAARRRCESRPPAAIIVDQESYATRGAEVAGLFERSSRVLLFAFTRRTEPAVALNLLDAGFDDVFSPPFNFEVVIARISQALRGHAHYGVRGQKPGSFGATFEAFGFIDLLQAMAQSLKTAHVHLTRSSGESADIYLERGQIRHARRGPHEGVEAIFGVIEWGNDGAFFVEPVDTIPEQNVFEPNEAILMEGCRLLDERVL